MLKIEEQSLPYNELTNKKKLKYIFLRTSCLRSQNSTVRVRSKIEPVDSKGQYRLSLHENIYINSCVSLARNHILESRHPENKLLNILDGFKVIRKRCNPRENYSFCTTPFRFILAVLIAVLSCCFAEILEGETVYTCFGNYLRNQKLLDKEMSNVNSLTEAECDAQLDTFRTVFYSTAEEELKNDKDLRNDAECIVEHMKKLHVAEISMKKIVYEHTKKMSKRKRNKAIKSIDYAIENKMTTAVKLCTVDTTFGAAFRILYLSGQSNDSEEAIDQKNEDYCLRKYMTENNFIDTTVYKVNLNPDNIDVNGIDCDRIVKDSIESGEESFKREFEDEDGHLSKQVSRCLTKTIREHKLVEASSKVMLLGEIGVSDEEAEKKIFVQKMSALYDAMISC